MPPEQLEDGCSKQRQCQMLRRHLSARRSYRAGCGDRSRQLQASLYRFLGERPMAEIGATQQSQRDGTNHSALRCIPRSETCAAKPQRRDVLLGAIESLQRLSLLPPELASGSNTNGCPAPSPSQRPDEPREDDSLTQQAQQLCDQLRYLALACNPAITQARAGGECGVTSCVGAEIMKKIAAARRQVDRMLRKRAGAGCAGFCKGSGEAPEEPLFWRLPGKDADADQSVQRHHCQQPRRRQRKQQRRFDPVAQLVARSKAALIGDQVFQVSCAGQEYRWGRMTLPTASGGPNAADRLGRENMHRRRLIEHRDAVRAEIGDFANKLEDKWETIEEARIDRAIDAACRRLRRALRGRPKKTSKHSQPTPQSKPLPTMLDTEEGADNIQNSDNCSIDWGV